MLDILKLEVALKAFSILGFHSHLACFPSVILVAAQNETAGERAAKCSTVILWLHSCVSVEETQRKEDNESFLF